MMTFAECFNDLIVNASRNIYEDDDYEVEGMRHCSLCHTPKQRYIDILGEYRKVPMLCKCGEVRAEAEKKEKEQRELFDRIQRLKTEGIQDKGYLNASFDSDDGKNPGIIDKAKRYVEKWQQMYEDNIGLLFYGDVGTGKSYTAACIANALLEQRVPVMMTSFPRLINGINALGFDGDKNEYIKSLNKYKLLIIDDLGAERQSDYMLEMVFTIIDERCKSKQPIIFTTNLTLGEIKNPTDIKYKRVYDRILEMTVPIKVDGDSRRKTINIEKLNRAKELFGV